MEQVTQKTDPCSSKTSEKIKKRSHTDPSNKKRYSKKKQKLGSNVTLSKKDRTLIVDSNENFESKQLNLFSKEGQQYLEDLNHELTILNEQANNSNSSAALSSNQIQTSHAACVSENIVSTPTKKTSQFTMANTSSQKQPQGKAEGSSSKQKGSPGKLKDVIAVPPEILRHLEHEIDEVLEEKACKNNLSTINVKNILRHVITNEHVLSMVRNTMREEKSSTEKQSAEDAIYEPKLTRSKAKELIKKQENVPWPISPIKKPQVVSCKFSDRLFSDEESSSDEEYDPSREIEDREGRSSPMSSPFPTSDGESESPHVSSPLAAITEEEPALIEESVNEETDNIALRTRSKLPLTDTPLESIEAGLIAPDITTDMYDSECDDDDWKNFLQEFVLPPPSANPNDAADDDADDPEYNFLEEEEELDTEDLRDDRAVKITKKEITDLMVELFEAADTELADGEGDEEDDLLDVASHTPADHAIETAKLALNAASSKDKNGASSQSETQLMFSDGQHQLLEDQMRKHVQFLTQGFILSSSVPELKDHADTCKALLIELQAIAITRAISSQQKTAFNAYNLIDAVQLVSSYEEKPDIEHPKQKQRKKCQVVSGFGISNIAMETFMDNLAFIYPELLPDCGFSVCDLKKLGFCDAEDVLLAMGLAQFHSLGGEFSLLQLIRQHMLPCKTESQIKIRIKRLRSKKVENNPVKFWYQHKKLEFSHPPIPKFDSEAVKKPKDQPSCLLPKWLANRVHRQQLQPVPIRPSQSPCLLASTPTTTQSFITASTPTINTKVQFQCPHECRTGSSNNIRSAESDAINPNVDSIIYVPSSMPNQVATVSVLNLQSATSSGPLITNIKTILKTPEKTISATIGREIPLSVSPGLPKRVSPLKKVSPILKKYSPKRMRKTGGNLTHTPLILPKLPRAIYLPPVKKASNRPLAPKLLSLDQEQSVQHKLGTASEFSTEFCNVTFEEKQTEEKDRLEEEIPGTSLPQEKSRELDVKDEDVITHEDELLSPPIIEIDSQSDPELFEDDEEPIDSAEDLAALMAASTTIQTTPRGRQQHLIARKTTRQKDIESTLPLLAPDLLESDPLKEDRETIFAQTYLLKVKELTKDKPHVYEEFLKLLYEFGQSDRPVNQLHRDVCKLLKSYPVLCDDFVAFLLPEQAMECGKLMEFLEVNKIRLFWRKLEVHFTKHPHHIQKLIKALAQCQHQTDLGMSHIKNIMQPLFRGQAHLMEEFLHLFPSERTPDSYLTDFEEIVLPDSDVELDEDGCELITLPDDEIDYGGKKCKCDCHNTQGPKFVSRVRHCASCGIKIINGRIYIQTRKALKPAHVTYLNPEDKQYVLEQQQQRTAQLSPKSIPLLSPPINSGLSETETAVTHIEPRSPSSQCSESSSVSSLSPTDLKDVEDEKEGTNELEVKQNYGITTHPLLEALGHLSQDAATTKVPLASDTVTEDAILTPDTSKANAHVPQDFSVLHLVLGKQKPQLKANVISLQETHEAEDNTGHQNAHGKLKKLEKQITENRLQENNINQSFLQPCSVLPDVVLSSTNIKPMRIASKKTSVRLARCSASSRKTETRGSSHSEVLNRSSCSKSPEKALSDVSPTLTMDVELEIPGNDEGKSQGGIKPTQNIDTEGCNPTSADERTDSNMPLSRQSTSTYLSSEVQEGSTTVETGLSAKNHSVDERGEVVVLWTRDADRIILQTCQKSGATREVFEKLAKRLKNKSVSEVTQRFTELISLFSEHQREKSGSDTSDDG